MSERAKEPNPIAVAMNKLRTAKLTAEERSAIARKAALSPRPNRFNAGRPKKKVEVLVPGESVVK